MNDDQLLRYSRQIMLPEIDLAGQERLATSQVLIVGAGGLGCPAALYLGAAGVGHLHLVDDDRVELSNLQRQIAHRTDAIGAYKVDSVTRAVQARNPEVTVTATRERLSGEALLTAVEATDLVVDGTDNLAARFQLNEACVHAGRPLVSAAVLRWDLQLTSFAAGGRPCYRCLYADAPERERACSESGVVGPLPGVGGTLQALEAIKILSGCGEPLHGRLMLLEALAMRQRILEIIPDPACPVCGEGAQ